MGALVGLGTAAGGESVGHGGWGECICRKGGEAVVGGYVWG